MKLEEVVVTSRKREENLQQVPVSVAALTAADLEKKSLDTLSEVSQSVPNFTFGGGSRPANSGFLYIRGVGEYQCCIYDPGVGVYVDGVYFGRMQGVDLDTMDMARLEILRGPQGTLFGKNTNGGAINFITREPDPAAGEVTGRLQVTGGSFERFDTLVSLNLPLADGKAALQFSGARLTQNGYGDRIVAGDHMGNKNRVIGRVALLVKPTDNLTAVFRFDGTNYEEENAAFRLVSTDGFNGFAPFIPIINAYLASHSLPTYGPQWLSPTPYSNYATGPNYSTGSLWGTSLTLTWNTDWATLKSITSYRKNIFREGVDATDTPSKIANLYSRTDQHQYSQEFQATGSSLGDRFKWTAGLYYFGEHGEFPSALDFSTFWASLGLPDLDTVGSNTLSNASYAIYGQGTYSLTDRLHLTAGIRETYDRKFLSAYGRGGFPASSGKLPDANSDYDAFSGPVTPGSYYAGRHGWTALSPRLSLEYQWTTDVMTYVSAAEGFKSGGFYGGSFSGVTQFYAYDPEKVWTYELGLRSDWLDQRLRVNATAFHSDYKGLQVQETVPLLVNGVLEPENIIANVPRSRVDGGELEFEAIPVRGVTLSAGFGLTDAKYTDVQLGGQVTTATRFPFTPKVSYTLGAEYTTAIAGNEITGRVDYSHKSAIDSDASNAASNNPILRQPPYGLINARVTLDCRDSGLSLSLFGTNLTGKAYFLSGGAGVGAPVGMAPPREWGASAQYRFGPR